MLTPKIGASSAGEAASLNLTTSDDGSGLPRIRRDEVAGYKVPALPDHVADLDPILATYVRAQQQQMHAYIDSYLTAAIAEDAAWVAAVGTRGTDPRRVTLWEKTVREIALSRVLADAPDDQADPLAYLYGSAKDAVEQRIERLHRRPQKSPYARYTAAELAAARRSTQSRLGENRMLLALAKDELARLRGDGSAVAAVDSGAAEVADLQRTIEKVREARTHLHVLRRSGTATAQQLAGASAAVSAAEDAASAENEWTIIERTAQFNRASAARHDRARATDEQAISRVTDRITRLEESSRPEEDTLAQLDAEIARRDGGTRRRTDPEARQSGPPSPTHHQPGVDENHHDRSPEPDL
ncbi:hypothetical protein [Rhodococcus coprophilus]|uniref:hypothetical protein n=1 Tax=Rhodococcus coprophilus TaxID=38310 RepID=UPI0009334908|nr:hypothetical protein [Rhodococcus coprophilus]MBM7460769.1 hypothetical protein [Rhodococcus coprophilus]